MLISMYEDEYWYGGYVSQGMVMPVGPMDQLQIDLAPNRTANQAMPLFVSSKGRYLWRDTGYTIQFDHGTISCPDDVEFVSGFNTLRGAYMAAMKRHFPFESIHLSKTLFNKPIFNSWIELTFYQNQQDLLQYAQGIVTNGFEPGVLMIDDGWSEYYGHWKFHSGKFQGPREMLEQLHAMGFSVMVWVCPFVTPDTIAYREARDLDILIKTPEGKPYICEWWNGYSAVLDFSNPATVKWFDQQMQQLQELGVDGFKFDAGDSYFYRMDNQTFGNVAPDEQSRLWAKYGTKYALNEYRVTYRAGGYSLMQRLCDKQHAWGDRGISALIPDTLLQGITGHPFSCPDMVGGGEYLNFQEVNRRGLDEELFYRHSEIACLMPAIQFSAAPWRVLSPDSLRIIQEHLKLRSKFTAKREQSYDQAVNNGEPMVRYMEYQFPGEGMEKVTDQFMLGDTLLVAPIYKKGATDRDVVLPQGKWRLEGEILTGGQTLRLTPSSPGPLVLELEVEQQS